MKKNIGKLDKIIRIILGIIIALLIYTNNYNDFYYIVPIILIATAIFDFCPIYRLFGFRTCKISKKK